MTSFMFRELMVACVMLRGNFYAWIERDALNRPIALWPLNPGKAYPIKYKNEIWYDTESGYIPSYDIIHVAGMGFDGVLGYSPIRLQAQQLGISLNAQQYGSDFFQKGATVGGILAAEGTLTKEQREQLKAAWHSDAHGAANNHGTKIVEGGLKYQRIGVPPEEAQFLETRKLGGVEICGMYRVPPHMVAILDRSTNNNIEHQGIDFVKYTLSPWLMRIEQEFNRKLYRQSEKASYFNGFNVNGLLKGDIAAQTQHIKEMMDRGVYSINDALSFIGQNTIGDEGRRRMVMRNMVPLDRVDDTIPQKEDNNTPDGERN